MLRWLVRYSYFDCEVPEIVVVTGYDFGGVSDYGYEGGGCGGDDDCGGGGGCFDGCI